MFIVATQNMTIIEYHSKKYGVKDSGVPQSRRAVGETLPIGGFEDS